MKPQSSDADPCLSVDQIIAITHYEKPAKQLALLIAQGYPAFMRPDNTVSLGRAQYERGPVQNKPSTVILPAPIIHPLGSPRHDKGNEARKKQAAR